MDDNFVIITINNIDYYIDATRLKDLNYINNKLVNTSNSSITLVYNYDYQNTTYPRIVCSAQSQCYLQQNNTSTRVGVTSNYQLKGNYNFNILSTNMFNFIILFVLSIYVFYSLFIKK